MHLLERRDPKRQKITPADAAKKPDVCWPLVRRHPDTGRLSLYLNPKNTRRVCELPRRGWPAKAGKTVDEGDAMDVQNSISCLYVLFYPRILLLFHHYNVNYFPLSS